MAKSSIANRPLQKSRYQRILPLFEELREADFPNATSVEVVKSATPLGRAVGRIAGSQTVTFEATRPARDGEIGAYISYTARLKAKVAKGYVLLGEDERRDNGVLLLDSGHITQSILHGDHFTNADITTPLPDNLINSRGRIATESSELIRLEDYRSLNRIVEPLERIVQHAA